MKNVNLTAGQVSALIWAIQRVQRQYHPDDDNRYRLLDQAERKLVKA